VRLIVRQRLTERVGPDKTMAFRLVFEKPTDLPVDSHVELDIDAEERFDAVLIPAEALIQQGGQAAVMVAAGDRAERRAVTTGIADEQRVEITSGLRAGELVITRGLIGLTDGAAISVATEP
jgi:multidrug efflux pump subunit AcrA (membrane-fusion protein)